MIRLESVHKSFGSVPAVHGVDLAVDEGETLALIGPSGCGKSTLLRLMLGLLQPDAGTVQFHGRDLSEQPPPEYRHRMGYVIQDGGLFPHLTARENILLMARQLRWERVRRERRLENLVALTRFPEDGLDRYPAELSGGQRQRVALMRALFLDPEALLLDEPLGALDPMVRFELQRELKEIFRSLGKTTVLVTHDLSEAAYFGHRLVLMRDGSVVQTGTLRELRETPADPFISQFLRAQEGVEE